MTGQELPEDGKSECHHHPDHPTQEGEFSVQSGDLLFEVGFGLHEVRPGAPPPQSLDHDLSVGFFGHIGKGRQEKIRIVFPKK